MPDQGDQYYITFASENGIVVRVLLDAASPNLSGGFGGWEVVDRPKRESMTRFKGSQPFQQDIAILFDGLEDGEDQESYINDLMRMSDPVGKLKQPPKVSITGIADRTDLSWVIQDIKFSTDNVIRDMVDGSIVRLRQAATVTLLEFVDDQVIITRSSPAVVARTSVTAPKVVKSPQNATLRSLAIKFYHDPSQWQVIWLANPFLVHDPRAIIPHGTSVVIPGHLITKV